MINAVELSFRERRWVSLPLAVTLSAALDRFFEHYYRRRPVNATFTGRPRVRRRAAGLVAAPAG